MIAAAERLDSAAFDKAVGLLAPMSGKVVATGAGTSGIIARKIAGTMTSTGTPAIFLHPGDALHGGLGAVGPEDVVVAVSNSGETDELKAILPYLRHRQVAIIAIVGRLESTLARAADVALDAGAAEEACPFNLAPTSSTTVAMAVGDALAIALYDARGLTPEQFALNHPSGALGRRLTLRVADVMHAGDAFPRVAPEAAWIDVVSRISEGGLGAAAVVNSDGTLLGIVTDGDLRRAMQERGAATSDSQAQDVMTADPTVVGADELAYNALQLMEDRPSQISVLPVVDADRRCLGIVRVHDLVRAGL
ncbi:MAG TPA: KpsF/GutQ family sugar-phosphate isomerase [Acidimicrobiia bacterium]|nr:KpsF/GutQ family sugar-phosphate isomerase [Acidimicrobiia bacterium]